MNTEEEEEVLTIEDVISNLKHIQDMKLLFLQGVKFFNRDVFIYRIVSKNALIRIIKKYPTHYSDLIIENDTITIKNLCRLSFLRVGLKKEILRFMEPYFS